MGFLDFYDITFSITVNRDLGYILVITLSISIGGSIAGYLLFYLVKSIRSLFKPKFVRIADNLENAISQKRFAIRHLKIPFRKIHVVDRMEHIWEKGNLQYPLSELNFEKMLGGKPHD
jgi:hypothetical protein